jgi:hypothetical protein
MRREVTDVILFRKRLAHIEAITALTCTTMNTVAAGLRSGAAAL